MTVTVGSAGSSGTVAGRSTGHPTTSTGPRNRPTLVAVARELAMSAVGRLVAANRRRRLFDRRPPPAPITLCRCATQGVPVSRAAIPP